MGIEAQIKTALSGLAGGRIYPDVPPDGATFPLVIYQQVGGAALNTLECDVPGTENARIQVVVWAKTRIAASELARDVRDALTVTLKAYTYAAPVSLYDDTLKLYGSRADYSLWFTP